MYISYMYTDIHICVYIYIFICMDIEPCLSCVVHGCERHRHCSIEVEGVCVWEGGRQRVCIEGVVCVRESGLGVVFRVHFYLQHNIPMRDMTHSYAWRTLWNIWNKRRHLSLVRRLLSLVRRPLLSLVRRGTCVFPGRVTLGLCICKLRAKEDGGWLTRDTGTGIGAEICNNCCSCNSRRQGQKRQEQDI